MPTIKLGENDSGQTLEVALGTRVELRLPEPVTGYEWAVARLDAGLWLEDDSHVSGAVGGGERVLAFVAQHAGTAELELKLWREWEGDDSVSQRFSMTAVIT